jgi:hypothetical protein
VSAGSLEAYSCRSWAAAAFVLLCLASPLSAETRNTADPVQTRSFEVRFRPLSDAAELVNSVLSPDGEVTQQFRLKRLVVRDHLSVLEQVPSLLDSFDVPPRNVEVTVSLFLGSDRRDLETGRGKPGEISRELRGITETLGDFTKWTAYEPLGARSVTALEGTPVTLNLSDDYLVVFEIAAVHERRNATTIEFRSFSLRRVIRTGDGRERTQEQYSSSVMLPAGRLLAIGAAKGPEARQALFVGLQARPR